MTAIPFHDFARMLSEGMLNGIAAGIVLALLAWVLLRITGRQNSSTRFAVWFAALVAIAVLPFVSKFTPHGESLSASSSLAISLPASWAVWLVLLWAVIAAIGLLRLLMSLIGLRQVRENAVPIETSTLDPVLRQTLREFNSFRKVTLCISDRQQVPAAIGFFRPLVVFPSWAMRELSVPELNSILIHELAHLRRWDDWTNLLQKVLHALFFFHPAIWWIESRISLEREMACDDVVLSRTVDARTYAECLVSMAEKSFLHRTLALTQAAVSRMRQTSRRVAQILDSDRPGATRVGKPALALIATLIVICGITQSQAPELVSFRDHEPAMPAVASTTSAYPALQLASLRVKGTEPSPLQPSKSAARHAVAKKMIRHAATPAAVDAKLDRSATVPMIQPAMLSEHPRVAETMLVVFHQQQYNSYGEVQWTVLVWRVSLQSPVAAPLPAKKI
jgi:beta-lactamase regulating signal transducer with metallopeptidase domain